jgi:CO/xanthine dehydrogenase Mo-binding subunit/aerobic-type carbon monoxide dehydrogenase small subunit (CoxS/CutS family)
MFPQITIHVNGQTHQLEIDPETPLLYVLRNDLGLKGVKYGCGSEQCGACKALVGGQAVPTCKLPVKNVIGAQIVTIEGLGTPDDLHPLQEAFIEAQAIQCGYCTSGMITAAQGLLNRVRYPSDDEIREGLAENLCRCGAHDRVRRAVKLRVGRPDAGPIYQVISGEAFPVEAASQTQSEEWPSSLLKNPELDSWIRINTDGTVTVLTGKVELGQGIKTALAQIAAEELDVHLGRIRVATVDTDQSPDEGLTVGSMSLQSSGTAIRFAAAEARQILLSIAFEELEAPLERLTVQDGTITDPVTGRSTTYWMLFGGQRFAREFSGIGQPKSPDIHQIVGTPAKRLDLHEKVTGQPMYVHDLGLPGMLHARVVRPPHYAARLVSADIETARKMPDVVDVVRDGSFLAVIARKESQAINASEALQATAKWEGQHDFPPANALYDRLLSSPAESFLVVDGTSTDDLIPPVAAPSDAAHTIQASYYRPYQMHASLGPSAAVAQFINGVLTIWVHSQGVYPIRTAIAPVLGLQEEDIRVIQTEGSGCYGHNGADDAALDAALLALKFEGTPVSVKWMRADELTWEPYGPAMVMKMQASLSHEGQVLDWNHDVWSYPHLGRPRGGGRQSGLIAAWHLAEPWQKVQRRPIHAPHIGSHRNADPLYAFPQKRIVKHFVPDSPLRVSAMRGLGAYANVFAIESFMDELAHTAGIDPVAFRLRNLNDPQAKAVIQAAAEKMGWQPDQNMGTDRGRGIAFAQYKNRQCYAAVIVEVRVDRESGEIQLERAIIAADAGQIVNPDGLSNQLEGGFVQSASWTLKEQVNFDETGILASDWDSYPILRFPEVPKIETVLINRPELPFLGSGEAAQGPTPAAIANAVFDAVGVRLREIPFTPERVIQELRQYSP